MPNQENIIESPLYFLIAPLTAETFFADYYEQKSLLSSHGDTQRYRSLLNIARVDELIADSELPPAALQMARSKPPITRGDYTFANGNIDRGAVIRHYQQGATVILPQMHLADARLYDFCQALEHIFSAAVQTNIYLTPSGHQGFRTHYDDHDVFVIQVQGKKRWRLYHKPIENPYRGEGFRPDRYEAGEPLEDFVLNAGDCVYVPRGMMHDAANVDDEPSLHITVGLLVKTWADLMLEAISEVALRDEKFRRSLPPGFAGDGYDTTIARQYFRDLVERFQQKADFEESFELFVESFIRSQGAVVRGGIINGSGPHADSARFIQRRHAQYRLREAGNEAVLICAGGEVYFSGAEMPALETALSGRSFGWQDLNTISSQQARDMVNKLLAFGLIEKLKSSQEALN